MAGKRLEFFVGLFLLVGFFAFAFLALRVSGLTTSGSQETYTISAKFDDIGSLTTRAKVTIDGVIIGKVTAVELDKEDFMAKVTMEIDSFYNNLTEDTTASILTAGVLGEKYIGLSPGSDEEFLVDGSELFDTQSAIVLEKLIGKFMLNMGKK